MVRWRVGSQPRTTPSLIGAVDAPVLGAEAGAEPGTVDGAEATGTEAEERGVRGSITAGPLVLVTRGCDPGPSALELPPQPPAIAVDPTTPPPAPTAPPATT